jgi:hypothetical protein
VFCEAAVKSGGGEAVRYLGLALRKRPQNRDFSRPY